MTRVSFLDPAEQEMLEAADHYDRQTPGLGDEFLGELQRAVDHIVENPLLGPVLRKGVRRRIMRRFPYAVLYRLDPEEIVIIAVMHLRRQPEYWLNREFTRH
ncbi:MAG: type II toxin-antitoxin system RelE/ParE family toxin [Thermodesulfobacteriota bacterium]